MLWVAGVGREKGSIRGRCTFAWRGHAEQSRQPRNGVYAGDRRCRGSVLSKSGRRDGRLLAYPGFVRRGALAGAHHTMTADSRQPSQPRSGPQPGDVADPADFVLAVFDDAVEQARAAMLAACGKSDTWVDAVRAALCALLAFFDRDPRRRSARMPAPSGGDGLSRL